MDNMLLWGIGIPVLLVVFLVVLYLVVKVSTYAYYQGMYAFFQYRRKKDQKQK